MVLCYFYIVPTFLPVQAVIAIVVTILWIGPLLPILLLYLGTWGGGDPHSCFISSCNIGGFLKSWPVGGTGSHSSSHQDLRVHLRMQQMENRQRTEVQRKTHLGFWIKPCLHSVHLWAFHLYEPINALFFFFGHLQLKEFKPILMIHCLDSSPMKKDLPRNHEKHEQPPSFTSMPNPQFPACPRAAVWSHTCVNFVNKGFNSETTVWFSFKEPPKYKVWQKFSKCMIQEAVASAAPAWELVRNAHFQAPPQIS